VYRRDRRACDPSDDLTSELEAQLAAEPWDMTRVVMEPCASVIDVDSGCGHHHVQRVRYHHEPACSSTHGPQLVDIGFASEPGRDGGCTTRHNAMEDRWQLDGRGQHGSQSIEPIGERRRRCAHAEP